MYLARLRLMGLGAHGITQCLLLSLDALRSYDYLFKSRPAEGWKVERFDASSWKSGKAALGYGDKDLITKIGSNDLRKTVSRIYFRHEFSIEDLEINALKKLNISLLADDGALIYLNGREIIRYNLPEGEIKDDTKALKTAVAQARQSR